MASSVASPSGVLSRRIEEHHVVAHRAHAGTIQRVEQVGMLLAAPGPWSLARDRAVVDLHHDDLAGWLGLPRPVLDDLVEDRILGRAKAAIVGPVPAEPTERAQRQQRVEGESQA
jgi:hypothetical protein